MEHTYSRSKKFCVLLSNNPEATPCLAILQYVMLGKKNVFMLFEYFAYHLGSKLSTEGFISKTNFLSAADISMFYLETWRLQIA